MFPSVRNKTDDKIKYEIDDYAKKTPEYSQKKFEALKSGIYSVGQLHPILLRNNKIVDGRHRYKACQELGIEPKVKELGDISDTEVLKYVKALTVSKNKTDTQLAIEAYFLYEAEKANEEKTSLKKVAEELGVSVKAIQRAKYIAEVKPEYIKPLFEGKSVVIKDICKKQEIIISALRTIETILKSNAAQGGVETVEPTEDNEDKYELDWKILFETDDAFTWFIKLFEHNIIAHYQSVWWHLVEYANIQYPSKAEINLELLTKDDLEQVLQFSSRIPLELDRDKIINKIEEAIVKKKAI